jgi:hypothetical protein
MDVREQAEMAADISPSDCHEKSVSPRHRKIKILLAHLFIVVAVFDLDLAIWHRQWIAARVELRLLKYPTMPIEPPEAIGIAIRIAKVLIPAFAVWCVLQVTAAYLFCTNARGQGVFRILLFVALWATAWCPWFLYPFG